jgi:cobalt-zinc-cadmium efflux system membrane fusion protein
MKHKLSQALLLGLITIGLTSCKSGEETSATESESAEASALSEVVVHEKENCPAGDGCFICDPSTREEGRLWCKEHHRYEDRCWGCHPELEDKDRLFCKKHGTYEDECYLCHPELKEGDETASTDSASTANKTARASSETGLMCKEHGVLEKNCAVCHPELAPDLKAGESLKIRVASPDTIAKVGVRTSRPELSETQESVEAYCTVDYNHNRMAKITPIAKGIVREIKVVPGQEVTKDTVLATLYSPELAESNSRLLSALAAEKLASTTVKRERGLAKKQISAASNLETAEAALEVAKAESAAARQHLINLGQNINAIAQLQESGSTDSLLTVRAPFAGTIVERNASTGEMLEAGDPMLKLADLSSMWLELSVPAKEASRIETGMRVTAVFDDAPGMQIEAELIWIASAIDSKARRVQARALVVDPPAALRKGLYGTVRIETSIPKQSVTVPTDSIQTIDGNHFVSVQEEADLYAATRVDISSARAKAGTGPALTAITSGLSQSDSIVSSGSYILRSEFLKSKLGAGCVHE